jgi:hypothetical protein
MWCQKRFASCAALSAQPGDVTSGLLKYLEGHTGHRCLSGLRVCITFRPQRRPIPSRHSGLSIHCSSSSVFAIAFWIPSFHLTCGHPPILHKDIHFSTYLSPSLFAVLWSCPRHTSLVSFRIYFCKPFFLCNYMIRDFVFSVVLGFSLPNLSLYCQ